MAESDDKESKTEDATDKKLQGAIEKGNIPSSREASTLASFVAIFVAVSFFVTSNIVHLKNALTRFIDSPGGWRLENGADAVLLLHFLGQEMARLLIPVVLLLFFAGMGAAFLQNPPQLVITRIKPEWSRISPMKGLKRIFGLQGLIDFVKALFKLGAVGTVGFFVLRTMQADVFASMFMEPVVIPGLLQDAFLRLIGSVALLTTALVAADIFWSRFKWRKDLRMSKQDIKDEHKQTEGDPKVKARIRSLARDRARRRMIAAVPRATVIIANPTHYAIALRYVRAEGGAPLVLAKGLDLVALKIREVGEQHGIPIVEDKPLARSLYDSVEVDQLIPPQFYKAVAEIIYYLHIRKIQKPQGRT
jgi:flagellar biosynthetic protein FlhB